MNQCAYVLCRHVSVTLCVHVLNSVIALSYNYNRTYTYLHYHIWQAEIGSKNNECTHLKGMLIV